jgi:hypothetical protein
MVITDEKWPVARLIPISSASGVEAQERRLASALLAVMAAVPEFGNSLLKPLGAPSGKFETFIEVPFKLEGKQVRPDGVIVVTRAGKSWSALLEAKIAAHPLEPAQINAYLDLARDLGVLDDWVAVRRGKRGGLRERSHGLMLDSPGLWGSTPNGCIAGLGLTADAYGRR